MPVIIKRTGKRAGTLNVSILRLIKALPEKHAKGAAQLASELAPRSTPQTNPASAHPGYVHMADVIDAEPLTDSSWKVEVKKDYGIFPEMGTIYQEAQPFFRPANASAQRAMREEQRRVIDEAVKS